MSFTHMGREMTPEQRIRTALFRMMNDGFDSHFQPAVITKQISDFSVSMGASSVIEQVRVDPFDDTKVGRCFDNCIGLIRLVGGETVHGWAWHQFFDLLVVAEFHGVWRAPDNKLIDVTPPILPRATTTFSFDPVRTAPDVPPNAGPFASHAVAVPNHRFALKDVDEVREFLAAEEATALVTARRFQGNSVPDAEAAAVFERIAAARASLLNRARQR